MKPFEEWIKDEEPQYWEDLTLSETSFLRRIYDLEKKLDLPRPGATSVYVKEPKGNHHFPFACVLHFKSKAHAIRWWDQIEIEEGV